MIGDFISYKRRSAKKKVSQKAFLERLKSEHPSFDFTTTHLSNIETGKTIPNLMTLTALCRVLNVTDDDLPELFKAMNEELDQYEKRKQDL